jgi:osmotically inducible protein OsmC
VDDVIRKAWAIWKGGLKDGGGTISTESGVLKEAPYGFKARFENGPGTNPEELIGAAHAGCFSMALSLMLGEAGLTAEKIETHADVTLEKVDTGFAITSSRLTVSARIPGADNAKFQEIANKAKLGCPVSKLFKADITMDARLEA